MSPKELLDDIHKSIEEERTENPKIARFLDKSIRAYNRHWLIDNQNTSVMRKSGQEKNIVQVLIATRLEQLRHIIDLENKEIFSELCEKINNKIDNLFMSQAASDPMQDEPIELNDGTKIDFYKDFEYIIAQYDTNYPEKLEEKLMDAYERTLKHKDSRLINAGSLTERDKEKLEEVHTKNENIKEKRRKSLLEKLGIIEVTYEEVPEEPEKEENKAAETKQEASAATPEPKQEETRNAEEEINSLNEWALELGNYFVNDKNKLVRR
jgi:hypothetical protein